MNTDETIEVLASVYGFYKMPVSPEMIADWECEFSLVPQAIVFTGFKAWQHRDKSGFPPHVGMIAREVKHLLFPALGDTYEKAKARNAPLYRKAMKLEGTYPSRGKYHPEQIPIEMSEVPWIEKRIKETFEALQRDHEGQSIPTIVQSLIEKNAVPTLSRLQALGLPIPPEALKPRLNDEHDWKKTIGQIEGVKAMMARQVP